MMSPEYQSSRLHIGMLGCGSPARYAIIDPARQLPEVVAYGVASRSPEKAQRFATEHSIPEHYETYDALLADERIDLVYLGVPTRVHAEWALKALAHGKPVLCEKPLTRNAQQAEELLIAAESTGVPLIEGLYYRHHPVTRRLLELLKSGEIGKIVSMDTGFVVPAAITPPGHSRLRFDHAGGSALDPGCYCVHLLRLLSGEEPDRVTAEARLYAPNVDVAMTALLEFPGGCTGRFVTSLDSTADTVEYWLRISGEKGAISVPNPYGPHADPVITIQAGGNSRVEKLSETMTFFYQLQDVAKFLRGGSAEVTDSADSLRNMRVIDRVYQAAGLTPR